MRHVRVDTRGELRCWSCGSENFREKRTARSKVTFGIGALLGRKQLKCMVCYQYNRVGRAKPYVGPAKKRLGRRYSTFTYMHGEEGDSAVVGGWHPDPHERFELRWWDGAAWTGYVASGGVTTTDPV